jgi:hypothetical protein
MDPPCSAASFEVNSEPNTGARPSVRLCLGLNTFQLSLISYSDAEASSPGLLWRTVFLLGGKVVFLKQARELVVMNELESTGPLILPAGKVTQGDIPLRLMQTSIRFRLNRMYHGRHIKGELKEIRIGYFSLSMAAVINWGCGLHPRHAL